MRRRHGHLAGALVFALFATSTVALAVGPTDTAWDDPQLVFDGPYREPSIVAKGDWAHVAAVGSTGIWYLKNVGGSWTRTRLTRFNNDGQHQIDGRPIIALDPSDRSLTVFYNRLGEPNTAGDCGVINIRYVTNRSGSWSTPRRIGAASGSASSSCTSLTSALVRNGKLYVVGGYGFFDVPTVVRYFTDVSGSWTLASLRGEGRGSLALDGTGKPRIAYHRREEPAMASATAPQGSVCCAIRYARGATATGSFSTEQVVGAGDWGAPSLALSETGRPRIAYAGPGGAHFAYKDGSGWHASVVGHGATDAVLATGDFDEVHIMGTEYRVGPGPDRGLWHITNESGTWAEERVDTRNVADLGGLAARSSRLHVVFQRGHADPRVWYVQRFPFAAS